VAVFFYCGTLPAMCNSRQVGHWTGYRCTHSHRWTMRIAQIKSKQALVLTGQCTTPACILHMGTVSGGLGQAKSATGLHT